MDVSLRDIGSIHPYEKNAKKHPEKQVQKIAASIQKFGWGQPIVVDKDGVIIVGHGRFMAAHLLGHSEVPVLELDLTPDQAKAYRLADNKLNESDWDMELAIEELRSLSKELVDLTGFDGDLLLETEEDAPNLGGINVPRTKEGDVYDLGEHRLICGDSTMPDTYEKLLQGERARMIFTDPPYGIDYQSGSGITDSEHKFDGTGGRILNDDKTPAETLQFFKDILHQLHNYSTDDVNLYWWYSPRLTDVSMQAWRESGWKFSQIAIWLKNSFIYSPSQLYHRTYEPCMIGWKEGGSHYQDLSFTSYTELWNLDKQTFADHLDLWYQKRDNTNQYIHPTQKPVQLAERAIKRTSELGDIVLDAFGGSGSTLMACEQLGRRARLIELDPKYCDAIIGRYLKYTETDHVKKNGEDIIW